MYIYVCMYRHTPKTCKKNSSIFVFSSFNFSFDSDSPTSYLGFPKSVEFSTSSSPREISAAIFRLNEPSLVPYSSLAWMDQLAII